MATSKVTIAVRFDFGPLIQQLRDLADRLESEYGQIGDSDSSSVSITFPPSSDNPVTARS